jgi:hypothetical protein
MQPLEALMAPVLV